MRSSTRTAVIADPRLAVPGSTVGYGTFDTHHMDGMTASGSLPPGMARLSALASERGQALRHLLYLFERDQAIRLIRAG